MVTERKTVILTEDDPAIQDTIKLILQCTGFNVTVLANGNSLLNGNFDIPDLFILDKQLSGVDGLDVCRFLKSTPDTANIPIIIISASPQVEASALAAGANSFIEKPFRMQELRALVNSLI